MGYSRVWENKEIFGILESVDINNIEGSKVRNIFPCLLSSLSFNKSDAASAIYPSMSIERIRYSVVTVSTVKDPVPELIPKYKESVESQSKTSTGAAKTTASNDLKDADEEAKKLLGNISGQEPVKKTAQKDSLLNLNVTAQASAQGEFNNLGVEGRKAAIKQYGSEYNAVKAFGERTFKALSEGEGYKGATFEPR